jgi:cytochrome c-type biogenesis protein CcmH/NrfF
MSGEIQSFGYGLWGAGTVILLAGFVYAVIAYRRRAGREQRKIEERSVHSSR